MSSTCISASVRCLTLGIHGAGLPGIEPVVLTASLKHHFEAVGGNIVQITFEDTEVKVTGGIGGLLVSAQPGRLYPPPRPPPPWILTLFTSQSQLARHW